MLGILKILKHRFEERGDTLVEVLISIVVLAIVLTAAYALSTHSLGTGVDAQNRSKALSIANSQVAQIQNAQQGLSSGLEKYRQEPGVPFCIDGSGNIKHPTETPNPCTQNDFSYTVVYNKGTGVFTVTSKWAANSLSIYYKATAKFVNNDVCPPPAGPTGVQLTVPHGYKMVNGQCVPKGGGGGTTEVTLTDDSGPPHCVITQTDPPNGDCSNSHCNSVSDPTGCNNFNGGGSTITENCNPDCLCTVTLYDWNYSGTSVDTQYYVKAGCVPQGLGLGYPDPINYTSLQCDPGSTNSPPGCNACYPQVGDPGNCHDAKSCQDVGKVGDMSGDDYSTCKDGPPQPPPPTGSTGGGGTSCVPADWNHYCTDPGSDPNACANGANNPPTCNQCDAGETFSGGACTVDVSGGGSCFAAGTLVTTPTGLKAIEKIMPGDEVVSWDFALHKAVKTPVIETYKHTNESTVVLMTDQGRKLTTTAVHRFWTGTSWIEVGKMSVGTPLLNEYGQLEHVVSISGGPITDVYNLHVANASHDYYANKMLVHNLKPGF